MQSLPATFQDLAEFQRGVITNRQALQTGLTRDVIRAQFDGGRWQRIHRGVFAAFSGEPGRSALLWAAVLRAGPGAALSHYTAAELYGIARKPSQAIHVTVPASRRIKPIPGVVIRRSTRIRQARHPAQSPPPAPGSRKPCSISPMWRGPLTTPWAGYVRPAAAG